MQVHQKGSDAKNDKLQRSNKGDTVIWTLFENPSLHFVLVVFLAPFAVRLSAQLLQKGKAKPGGQLFSEWLVALLQHVTDLGTQHGHIHWQRPPVQQAIPKFQQTLHLGFEPELCTMDLDGAFAPQARGDLNPRWMAWTLARLDAILRPSWMLSCTSMHRAPVSQLEPK